MGNVTVDGLINGQELPSDRFISIRDSDEVRFGLARLERGANFTSLNVTRDFAGLLVDVDGRIDSNLLLQSRNDTQVFFSFAGQAKMNVEQKYFQSSLGLSDSGDHRS